MPKKYFYDVNPTCVGCNEEHEHWNVSIDEQQQKILDDYYEMHKGETSLSILLNPPPLYITSKFKCCECGCIFEAKVGIIRESFRGVIDDSE